MFLISEKNPEKNRDCLKKFGSNFQLADKSLSVEFKNPWKIIAKFNSSFISSSSDHTENSQILNWRREGDSNPRYSGKFLPLSLFVQFSGNSCVSSLTRKHGER